MDIPVEPCENCAAPVAFWSTIPVNLFMPSERGLDVIYGPRDACGRWWDRDEFMSAEEVAEMLSIPSPGPSYMWHEHTRERCRERRAASVQTEVRREEG